DQIHSPVAESADVGIREPHGRGDVVVFRGHLTLDTHIRIWDAISQYERESHDSNSETGGGFMQQRTDVPDRGLRRNAVGLAGLMAQSLGVTAPEISAVVIASVVAAKVAGATPFAFLIAGVGALALAIIYGRFARYVPN